MSFEITIMDRKVSITTMSSIGPHVKFNTGPNWEYHDTKEDSKVSEGALGGWKRHENEDEEAELVNDL